MTSTQTLQQRAFDFLWLVQAGYSAFAGSLRRNDLDREDIHLYSRTGGFNAVCDASDYLERIPDDKSALEASREYLDYIEGNGTLPYWFTGSAPTPRYDLLSKRNRFLFIVQIALTCDLEHRAVVDDDGSDAEAYSSATAEFVSRCAILASDRIPDDMNHGEAANEFVAFHLDRQKEEPAWCNGVAHMVAGMSSASRS